MLHAPRSINCRRCRLRRSRHCGGALAGSIKATVIARRLDVARRHRCGRGDAPSSVSARRSTHSAEATERSVGRLRAYDPAAGPTAAALYLALRWRTARRPRSWVRTSWSSRPHGPSSATCRGIAGRHRCATHHRGRTATARRARAPGRGA